MKFFSGQNNFFSSFDWHAVSNVLNRHRGSTSFCSSVKWLLQRSGDVNVPFPGLWRIVFCPAKKFIFPAKDAQL